MTGSNGTAGSWRTTNLGEIPTRGGWIPIRKELGLSAFGVNAWQPDADGHLIGQHDEEATGHQELYLVLEGLATFTLDDETIDAGPGALIFVGNPATRRAATAVPGTTVLAIGAPAGKAFTISQWEVGFAGFRLYRAGDYQAAFAEWEAAIESHPGMPRLHYNAACAAALIGNRDSAIQHLRCALELDSERLLNPREDDDFAELRGNADYEELLRQFG